MSAVCFLTGRSMFDAVDVPMGLVASSWGGTPVEAWNPQETLDRYSVSNNSFPIVRVHCLEKGPDYQQTCIFS